MRACVRGCVLHIHYYNTACKLYLFNSVVMCVFSLIFCSCCFSDVHIMSICTLHCIDLYSNVSYIFIFIVNLLFFIKIKSTAETSNFVHKVHDHNSTYLQFPI